MLLNNCYYNFKKNVNFKCYFYASFPFLTCGRYDSCISFTPVRFSFLNNFAYAILFLHANALRYPSHFATYIALIFMPPKPNMMFFDDLLPKYFSCYDV